MKAVVLVAGEGSRMMPLTYTRHKSMIPLANKPLLAHLLERLPKSVDGVVLIVGHKQESIRKFFGKKYSGKKIEYVEQKNPRGTGDAFLKAKKNVKGKFLGLVGDNLWSKQDFEKLIKNHQAQVTVAGQKVTDPKGLGVLITKGSKLQMIVEKPEKATGNLINTGLYLFEPSIFDYLQGLKPSARGEFEVTDAITQMAKAGNASWVEVKSWQDFTYPWQTLDLNQQLLQDIRPSVKGKVHRAANIQGPVVIEKGTEIFPGAYIQGPVVIGKNCRIGPNCFIRPYTSIGDNCHIGNGVEVKNSVIFSNTNVPHLNYVGDSVIAENCNFGAGTKIANLMHNGNVRMEIKGKLMDTGRKKLGAIIGDNTKTGINTSIYPGRKLGPNSLTDVAAVVIKNVPPDHILMNDRKLRKL